MLRLGGTPRASGLGLGGVAAGRRREERRVATDDDVARGASEHRRSVRLVLAVGLFNGVVVRGVGEPSEAEIVRIRQRRAIDAQHGFVFPRPARWQRVYRCALWDRGFEGRGRGYAGLYLDLACEGGGGGLGG